MTTILGVAIATYLGVLVLLFLFQRQLIFVPNRNTPSLREAGLDGLMTEIRLKTADGLDLLAWYRPPASESDPVLVFFHGNAGHIGHRAYRLPPFLESGFGILLVEYRGYGGNPGRPSEQGFDADGRAALDYLADQGIAVGRLVLYGESLGSGVAARMASERGCGALILEAPYTSLADVAQDRYWMFPVRALV
ncbi:MAG: alpha/beta hydrolase, partial [Dongiaceae bacterium]